MCANCNARLLKTGFHDAPSSLHRLLLSCAACAPHSLPFSRSLFVHIPSPDTLAYNTIIRAHSHSSPVHAISFFVNMRRGGVSPDHCTFPFVLKACSSLQVGMQLVGNVKPDEVTMLTVISAVSSLGALELGMWIDTFIRGSGLKLTVSLGTALIDMYSRCGSVDDSIRVFDEMLERNVLTWTALVNGLALHDRSREALDVFYEMKKYGLRRDHVTFGGVLVACSHGGLVADGWRVFDSIKNEYNMEPTLENYGCMVDLLGRAGLVNEAFDFVEKMHTRPNAVIWRTLLGACVNHKNVDLAEKVKERIYELDPNHDGDYVLLSNAYGGVGKWFEKAEVRTSMKEKRISKKPGYSLLNVDGAIHEFVSGDNSHPKSDETKDFLVSIINSLRIQGYIPCTSNVLHGIEEEERSIVLVFIVKSWQLLLGFSVFNIERL